MSKGKEFPPHVWVKTNNDNGDLGLEIREYRDGIAPMFPPSHRMGLPHYDTEYLSSAEHSHLLAEARAELLAEREKVRNLEEENKRLENALEKIRDLDYRLARHQSAHIAFNELSGIHAKRAAIRARKETE